MVDVKKLLESAQRAAEAGVDRPWTASNVRVGGVDFGTVQTTGREDTLDFIEAMKAADEMVVKAWAATATVPAATLRACSKSSEQQRQECKIYELQTCIEFSLAVLP